MSDHPSFLDRVRSWLTPSRKIAPQPLATAASFGKYRLIREIGRGGAGVVHEAEDVDLRRRVAVKILKEDEADPVQVRRLHREAAIAAQLRHPNIVSVYDVGMIPGPSARALHFIAMEYVDGRPFSRILHEEEWTIEKRIDVFEQVVRGVAHAHSQGILHRDLKPANVLVDRGGRVVLSDFGLARAMAWHTRLTDSHSVLGSPSYMAPEQVSGSTHEIDERTDVYACGVILYEILCDALPFSADTPVALFQKILAEEPTTPSKRRRGIDPGLEAICLRAMAKERKLRYACGQDLLDDLLRWRRHEPVRAGRTGLWRRIARRARRHKAAIVAWVALGLALLVAAVYVVGWELPKRRRLASEREALQNLEEDRRQLGMLGMAITNAKNELRSLRVPAAKARGDLEEAQRQVRAFIARRPEEPRGYHTLALSQIYLGDLEGAAESARRAVTKRPDFRPGWSLFGVVRVRQYAAALADGLLTRGNLGPLLDEAEGAFARGWEAGREKEEAQRWGLAWTSEDEVLERVGRALRLRFIDRKQEEAREFLVAGWSEYQSEEFALWIGRWSEEVSERMRWFARALERAPRHPDTLLSRGNTRIHTKDYEGAVADYTQAVEVRPGFATAYGNRGVAKLGLRCYEETIADCDRALELRSDLAGAYNSRGFAKYALKRYEEALADFDRAVEIQRDYAEAYCNRGEVKHALKRYEEAIADYEEALRTAPADWPQRVAVEKKVRELKRTP